MNKSRGESPCFNEFWCRWNLTEKCLTAGDVAFDLVRKFKSQVTLLHVIETIEHVTFDEMKDWHELVSQGLSSEANPNPVTRCPCAALVSPVFGLFVKFPCHGSQPPGVVSPTAYASRSVGLPAPSSTGRLLATRVLKDTAIEEFPSGGGEKT